MVSLKSFFLFTAVATATTLQDGRTNAVLNDLTNVSYDLEILLSTIGGWTGGLFAAIPIAVAAITLTTHIQNATDNAAALSDVSVTDAEAILQSVTNLQASAANILKSMSNQVSLFKQAGVGSTALKYLNIIKGDVDALADALIKQAPGPVMAGAQGAKQGLDASFSAATGTFTLEGQSICVTLLGSLGIRSYRQRSS
jgi:hypothetical protein